MAFSLSVTVTLPGKTFANKKWFDEMAKDQRNTTVPQLRKLFDKTVFGWSAKNKPTFGWNQTRSADEMTITMYPQGNPDIWNLVNAGSPPHPIPARPGGLLRFRPGYLAATTPGSIQSRRAYRSGQYVVSKLVHHPGFPPRDFVKLIAEEYRARFTDDMQNAINVVAKQ